MFFFNKNNKCNLVSTKVANMGAVIIIQIKYLIQSHRNKKKKSKVKKSSNDRFPELPDFL